MRLRLNQQRTVTSVFVMFTALCTGAAAATCEELQCLHGNPCQAVVNANNTTHASCICGGKWAGPRCGHLIRLEPQQVTASYATFKVDLMTSQEEPVPSSSLSAMPLVSAWHKGSGTVKLNFTLVYWRRNDTVTSQATPGASVMSGEVTCVLHHQKDSGETTLRGVEPRTLYTVCVENGFVDSCLLSSFSDSFSQSVASLPSLAQFIASRTDMTSSWPSNCVTIRTPAQSSELDSLTRSTTVTAVAVVAVFVLGAFIVVFIVFLLRRQSVPFRLCVDAAWQRCRVCCKCLRCGEGPEAYNSEDSVSLGGGSAVHHYSFPAEASFLSPGTAVDFMNNDLLSGSKPRKRRTLAELLKRRKKAKKQRSSTYATASLRQPPSGSLQPGPFSSDESSPLGCEIDHVTEVDHFTEIDHLTGLEVGDGGGGACSSSGKARAVCSSSLAVSGHALPSVYKRRSKGHRLSRKRRGYVAYTAKKDKNIRLTTVLEIPLDDVDLVAVCGDGEVTI